MPSPDAEFRPRDAVKLAITKTRLKSVRRWLLSDERGVFEKDARVLWEIASTHKDFPAMPMQAIVDQIATMLALRAIEALAKQAS